MSFINNIKTINPGLELSTEKSGNVSKPHAIARITNKNYLASFDEELPIHACKFAILI